MEAPQVIGKLVGCKHYRGAYRRAALLLIGEGVVISRNPQSPFDSNAVEVLDVEGLKLGHLDAYTAAVISPYIDSGVVYLATVVKRLETKLAKGRVWYRRGSCHIRCVPLPPLRKPVSVEHEQWV